MKTEQRYPGNLNANHFVPGVLFQFEKIRSCILSDVIQQTQQEFKSAPLELLLSEALYSERLRLKRNPKSLFAHSRNKKDKKFWNKIQTGLLQPQAICDRTQLLHSTLEHYAEEIGGHFNPSVYQFAIHAVPWGFNWLLNAASVRRFLPWGMTKSLESSLQIEGEIAHLQKLSQKGTILLVPTHQSNIDSVLIGYVIYLLSLPPFAYGAGLNLFSNPVLSFFMSNLGAYTVDRHKINFIYKTILKNYSTLILREGIHSIFFPGGGRSRSGSIESNLKLGLLGTALQAQLQNLMANHPKPHVYIVPMVMSYHFVLEAATLIEDYLMEAGKHRFIIMDDESWQPLKILNFFWKLFASTSTITVRIGRPLDIFGNFVDEEGASLGPNHTTIDPRHWLTTRGILQPENQRDKEYTRELGLKLVERFHAENTVLSSHFAAFAFFETLRRKYADLDLFRLLRITQSQRSLSLASFLKFAEPIHRRVHAIAQARKLFLSPILKTNDLQATILDGVRNLGLLHDAAVLKIENEIIWTEDMNLLFYYHNRLTGYSLEASYHE